MIVALGLPSKVATIILGCIFSMLLSDFTAHGSISIPIPPIMTLTEFFHADVETNAHLLLVSWYLMWMYLSSCMHIMSMLWSITEAVSSGSCPILFKILTLNVAICIERLHFSNFCFSWSSVANFSNTRARAPTSAECARFYLRDERCGLDKWFECQSW